MEHRNPIFAKCNKLIIKNCNILLDGRTGTKFEAIIYVVYIL